MSGLMESATAIMQMAERRLDVVAHNVANISTPGYKRRIGFSQVMAATNGLPDASSLPVTSIRSDASAGKLQETGNSFDLAIGGEGYFRLRAGDRMLHSRQGQFRRSPDGLLLTPQGYVLQQAGGGDLVLDTASVRVERDGMVIDGGRPIARVAVDRIGDAASPTAMSGSFFAAPEGALEEVDDVQVRQGMLEASNVSLGDEMTQSMAALRQAESGARLVQLYDDLMGRVIGTFASGGR